MKIMSTSIWLSMPTMVAGTGKETPDLRAATSNIIPKLYGAVPATNSKPDRSSESGGNGVDGIGGANAAGISHSTIHCQQAVYQDAKTGIYNSIDAPLNIVSFDNLSKYGDAFAKVTATPLAPGTVTPSWTDEDGNERGQAVLWVPDDVIFEDKRGSPRLLYVHGGSWTSGSPMTDGYATFAAKMARLYLFPVLAIDYTLVPFGNFSSILEEIGMAANFLATHEPLDVIHGNLEATAIDPSHQPTVFISGDSSGGGSAVSALVAQASPGGLPGANGAMLSAGVVFSPWINLESNSPTYYSQLFGVHEEGGDLLGDINFGRGQNLTSVVKESMEGGKSYSANVKNPIANPMYAPRSWLKDLVPLSLHVGMSELLQSDSALFAMRATKAGAQWIENHSFDGMWHVFQMYSQGCGIESDVPLAESSLRFSRQFFNDVLSSSLEKGRGRPIHCFVPHYEYPTGVDSAEGIRCTGGFSFDA